MILIGLTGPTCAGKNYAAKILEEKGVSSLDVDKLGHIALENKKNEIKAAFGEEILDEGGAINRRKLGSIVFKNPAALRILENIVHPETGRLAAEWVSAQNKRFLQETANGGADSRFSGVCVINAALLNKTPFKDLFSGIILVKSPVFLRALRAKRRDALSFSEIFSRLKSQRKFTQKFLPKNADISCIMNVGIGPFQKWERKNFEKRLEKILRSFILKNSTLASQKWPL
ncbi:MAG: dephospho-CoA kinase [Spirochaetaceae bacterium]|jgi:dephospho-CoA kinase|nr:dephospho-CoA kinase [Spirochaetaceae bacterium]